MLSLLAALVLTAPAADEAPGPHARWTGIGVEVGSDQAIRAVLEGSPAWKAGIRPGMTVTRVDGERAMWMGPELIAWHLEGPPGRGVEVRLSATDGPLTVSILREAFDPWAGTWHTDAGSAPREVTCVKGDCADGTGTVRFSWGGGFAGVFEGGLPSGTGALKSADGTVVVGALEEGRLEDRATLRRDGGTRIEGAWDHGIQYGPMEVYKDDVLAYQGEGIGTVEHGLGERFPRPGQEAYVGSFYSGRYHGEGRLELPSGDVYEGRFIHGVAHGEGTFTQAGGGVLRGGFVKGRLQGPGHREWADGRVYDGAFVDNDASGEGRMVRPDGTVHQGDFVDGKARGYGVRDFPSGRRVEGIFVDLHRAVGRLYDADGVLIHEGWTRLGRAEGWGRAVKEDGSRTRERWWFNDGPHRLPSHPRNVDLGDDEQETFEGIDWDRDGRAAFE